MGMLRLWIFLFECIDFCSYVITKGLHMKMLRYFFILVFFVQFFFNSGIEAAAPPLWQEWLTGAQGFEQETETMPQLRHVRLSYCSIEPTR